MADNEILLGPGEIKSKVKELGARITADYQGKQLLVVGILKGAFMFMADLIRTIEIPLYVDFMDVTSYGQSTMSSGVVRIMKDLETEIEGKDVLIVEDIIDTGLTLKYIRDNLLARKPASVRICTFLDKPSRREVEIAPDYNGFSIPDLFVVGYGLDFAEQHRQHPYVCILNQKD
jgi:hypoxanthine phosphoribosyltransferase